MKHILLKACEGSPLARNHQDVLTPKQLLSHLIWSKTHSYYLYGKTSNFFRGLSKQAKV